MKKNKTRLLPLLVGSLLIGTFTFLSNCSKKDAGTPFTLSGLVLDESENPVSAATVKTGNSSATTSADGKFTLSSVSSGQSNFQVEANAGGYFTGHQNVDNIDGSSLSTTIHLIAKNNLGTIPAAGGQAGSTGLRVIAPSGAFTNADGSVYTGAVKVASKYIKGNNANISNLMPGGDFMAKDENGNDGAMLSYGFVATEFTDANGNKLTPNANVKVAVTMPSGVNNPISNGAKCWGYNGGSGNWGNNTPVTQTGNEFFFPATTLFQNIDKFALGFGTIQGQVLCSDGKPVAFANITLQSTSYNNKYVTKTNANGKYRAKVAVKDGSIVFNYNVSVEGGGSVAVNNVPVKGTVTADNLTTSMCSNSATGSGSFNFGGQNYSGPCVAIPATGSGCGGQDVTIISTSGSGEGFLVYNMPSQNSGTYSFNDGYQVVGSCSLYALTSSINGTQYATKSGSLTKTSANSYTFTCVMYDIITNNTYNVSGSGKY